jgi:hypothetical protein
MVADLPTPYKFDALATIMITVLGTIGGALGGQVTASIVTSGRRVVATTVPLTTGKASSCSPP